jgi:hypothetical protein
VKKFDLLLIVCWLNFFFFSNTLKGQPSLVPDTIANKVQFMDTLWVNGPNASENLKRASFWVKSIHAKNLQSNEQMHTLTAEGKTYIGRPLSSPLHIHYKIDIATTDSTCIYHFRNIRLAEGNTPTLTYPADTALVAEEKSRPYPSPISEKLGQTGYSLEHWMDKKPGPSDSVAANQVSAYFIRRSSKNLTLSALLTAVGISAGGFMFANIHHTNSVPQVLAGGAIISISAAVLTAIKGIEYRKIARQEDAFSSK